MGQNTKNLEYIGNMSKYAKYIFLIKGHYMIAMIQETRILSQNLDLTLPVT